MTQLPFCCCHLRSKNYFRKLLPDYILLGIIGKISPNIRIYSRFFCLVE